MMHKKINPGNPGFIVSKIYPGNTLRVDPEPGPPAGWRRDTDIVHPDIQE
jgi:hypothetical protein